MAKKIIEYGAVPTPAQIADQTTYNLIQEAPIDGFGFGTVLNSGDDLANETLSRVTYSLDDLTSSIDYIQSRNHLGWGRTVHNFSRAKITSSEFAVIDWFEADINSFLRNLILVGDFCDEVGVNMLFDVEAYVPMWTYDEMPLKADHSIDDYVERAYECGEIVASGLRRHRDLNVWLTFGYEGYANALSGSDETNSWFLYKPFLDALHDVFGANQTKQIVSPTRMIGRPAQGKIIQSTEVSYACLTTECLENAYRQVSGDYGDDWAGDSAYFGEVDTFGLSLWIDRAGKLPFDPETPDDNYFTPDTFKTSLDYALSYSDFVWIYDEDNHLWGSPYVGDGYISKIRELRQENNFR